MLNGATFAPGIVGQAFSFDGVDYYVDIGNIAEFDITSTSSMSITVWFKTSTVGYIVNKADVISPDAGWLLEMEPSGAVWFNVAIGDEFAIARTTALNDDRWHFVAAAHDSGTGRMVLYVDGVRRGATTENFGAIDDGGMPLRIGMSSQGLHPFNGLIDKVRIYNRVLSAEEIKARYDAVTPTSG